MLKKFGFIMMASLASFSASAYTITCNFDDGLGWEINTNDQMWGAYYLGVCTGQGGDAILSQTQE